ncbi:DMT family transporter [Tardiphaga sp. 1201_B9_N1_1]|uniref:DMT family transporter n=1 Tax=unclassified Tardiphaga TaxID=2631404 RepID=UPI000E72A8FD
MSLSPSLRGSVLMAIAMAGFSLNDALTKFLTLHMNFGQVMLVRGLFAVVLIGALATQRKALRPLRILFVPSVALRVFGEIGGTVTFLASLAHLPLANVSSIFQSLPLAITLGAALIFGEQVGWRRWLAIAAGFVGVLIVVRPGMEGFNQFSLLALLSVAFCTVRDLATKRIPTEIPSLFVTFLTTIVVTIVGAILLVPLGGWTPPSNGALALLLLAAVLVLIGYQCVILALRAGDISAVAPFRYSQLLWAMLLGYLVFGDVPDGPMVLGASVIVLSGLYAFHRERVRNRLPAASAPSMPPDGL